MNCPFCDSGELFEASHSQSIEIGGESFEVGGLRSYGCDNCGEISIFPDQSRFNRARISDAKRSFLGFLSGEEIREFREHAGLSQEDCSKIFGGGRNAFSKYERGDVIQSASMDKLIRVAAIHDQVLSNLAKIAGVNLPSLYQYFDVDKKVVGCDFARRISGAQREVKYLEVSEYEGAYK